MAYTGEHRLTVILGEQIEVYGWQLVLMHLKQIADGGIDYMLTIDEKKEADLLSTLSAALNDAAIAASFVDGN